MSTESNTQTQQQTLSGFNYKEKKRRDEVHNMTWNKHTNNTTLYLQLKI